MPCYVDCEKPEKENQESTNPYVDPDDLDDQSYGVIHLKFFNTLKYNVSTLVVRSVDR